MSLLQDVLQSFFPAKEKKSAPVSPKIEATESSEVDIAIIQPAGDITPSIRCYST